MSVTFSKEANASNEDQISKTGIMDYEGKCKEEKLKMRMILTINTTMSFVRVKYEHYFNNLAEME